ncbi:MAG: DUF2202 domain-containing protein [Coriobacteriia bacterium]|nr:DUF2202 domain-containing protein [Coriobacteriia bacterium]
MRRSLNRTAGFIAAASLALVLTVSAVACAPTRSAVDVATSVTATTPSTAADSQLAANVGTPVPTTTPASAADSQLAADLAFMREEERLAHDVYTVLALKWGTPVFTNIAASEQQHTDTMAALLSRYGVADPAAGEAAGVYAYPALQELYNQLVAKGSTSVTAAFEVGKTIEEVDIADLDERIARNDEADVLAAFKNLRAGSENHLRAFNNQL